MCNYVKNAISDTCVSQDIIINVASPTLIAVTSRINQLSSYFIRGINIEVRKSFSHVKRQNVRKKPKKKKNKKTKKKKKKKKKNREMIRRISKLNIPG